MPLKPDPVQVAAAKVGRWKEENLPGYINAAQAAATAESTGVSSSGFEAPVVLDDRDLYRVFLGEQAEPL